MNPTDVIGQCAKCGGNLTNPHTCVHEIKLELNPELEKYLKEHADHRERSKDVSTGTY